MIDPIRIYRFSGEVHQHHIGRELTRENPIFFSEIATTFQQAKDRVEDVLGEVPDMIMYAPHETLKGIWFFDLKSVEAIG